MTKLHLQQPECTSSACGKLTKHREMIKRFKETGNLNHIYKNALDKACFADDAAHSDSKDLAKRFRAYEIPRNPKYDGIKED